MFSDEEIESYQNEFRKITDKVNEEEVKLILDFFYQLGIVAYGHYNDEKLKESLYGM